MTEQIEKMEELLELLAVRKLWLEYEMKYVKEKQKKLRWMLNNLNQVELDLDEVRQRSQSKPDGWRQSDKV